MQPSTCIPKSPHRPFRPHPPFLHSHVSKFNHIVTGDRVSRSKPAPDIFHKAAALFEPAPAPAHVLVFEDAPTGVAAAKAAGMHVCMVPDPQLDRQLTLGADQVLTSLEDFVPEAWGLPSY